MAQPWTDYAERATARWTELGVEVDTDIYRAGLRLERVARRHEAMLNDALAQFRPAGVRGIEDFRLLSLLARKHPATTSATAASKVLGLSKAATATRIERFDADGLVERAASQYDKRTVQVRTSEQGFSLATECVAEVARVHDRFFHGIDGTELEAFTGTLAKITTRIV